MKMKEPKSFKDICELQKELDSHIVNVRERTGRDIIKSMIAEIIEFDEETKDSHKTWKTKEYNSQKELEELTDVYFFFAQLVNNEKYLEEWKLEELFNKKETEIFKPDSLTMIMYATGVVRSLYSVFSALVDLTLEYGYTKEDILKTYWKKWQYNMSERIGKEWN
ncbi:dUTP diphosphatase [Fusobacterium necrophorum subsp. funduliforme]|uniref:dUTP diphosphatase n=1 Tax=Fusobacterium necrophorum TaxID=859 RepID=UPI000788AAEB|nr:dUTP diphosphatase [Fusobacterium necrophorum subsp. funduliforme]